MPNSGYCSPPPRSLPAAYNTHAHTHTHIPAHASPPRVYPPPYALRRQKKKNSRRKNRRGKAPYPPTPVRTQGHGHGHGGERGGWRWGEALRVDSGNSADDSYARHARLLARAYADKIGGFAGCSKGSDRGSSRGSWQHQKGDPFCPTPPPRYPDSHAHAHAAAVFTRRLLAWAKKEAQAHAPGCLSASPPCECERPAAAAAAQESERTEANEFNLSNATSSRSPGDSDAWTAPWLLAASC
ncbi:hypothetical protein COCC4DRAFT_66905 [Bipolaris maydis ATCC 48331]|uniref:Uncharacterized protein n=2 Tax=Cochliobolus heterostrophus TaxID=5016 RepID=M2TT64_COCH5|nr:uncharacterized protein COCC4DRAFT_66905 [Bipolaris maydis ATCC 48331]EMD84971.1 hypothetical protein COCHEDRAFT_1035832 [Bipolaris maydis C5]ENH98931.1 hypothetical protein COCC4DRAFT_66905 [Bipolaris maydis ATCC 48331]KAJ5027524.1 hypothetical protein J3E73DRAFT_187615 [Bipolaris maydis]KAJ6208666.1 hypothetical protein PSV09DRAFT_1035832 [Bipolaris maydis]